MVGGGGESTLHVTKAGLFQTVFFISFLTTSRAARNKMLSFHKLSSKTCSAI